MRAVALRAAAALVLIVACVPGGDGASNDPTPADLSPPGTPSTRAVEITLDAATSQREAAVPLTPDATMLLVTVGRFADPGRAVAIRVTTGAGALLGVLAPLPSREARTFGLPLPAGVGPTGGTLHVVVELLAVTEGEELPDTELRLRLRTGTTT